MIILRNLFQFIVPLKEMINIYILYIRSVTEQNSNVWSSSITKDEENDFERTHKVALKIILKDKYISYENALAQTNLTKLKDRRKQLLLKFAIKYKENPKTKDMFPLHDITKIPGTQKNSK